MDASRLPAFLQDERVVLPLGVLLLLGILAAYLLRLERSRREGRIELRDFLACEIARCQRHGGFFGILVLEVSESTRRGLHQLIPGQTLRVEHVSRHVRKYDTVIASGRRTYTVMLPETSAKEGVQVVKDRFLRVAEQERWAATRVGMAVFPYDGEDPDALLRTAYADLGGRHAARPEPAADCPAPPSPPRSPGADRRGKA